MMAVGRAEVQRGGVQAEAGLPAGYDFGGQSS